jgi:hypothetical protein
MRGRRYTVVALALAGAILFGASYFLPYWNFHLVAPQYPNGLSLQIALSGMKGDVSEIDILNHYIGMRKMSTAASVETMMGPYLVVVVALSAVAGVLATGKRFGWLGLIPAIGLPLGFVADVVGWMYRFGHDLDPDAPLHFAPFMPHVLGNGTIGQFHTTAWPASGFWLALVAAALIGTAVAMRKRVCDSCPVRGDCGASCTHLMFRIPE